MVGSLAIGMLSGGKFSNSDVYCVVIGTLSDGMLSDGNFSAWDV